MRRMNKLLRIECFKLIKSKKNRLIFCLFILFLLGIILFNTYMERNYIKSVIKEMKDEKKYADEYISFINLQLEKGKNVPADAEDKKAFWTKESVISLQLEYYFKEYDGDKYNDGGWEKYLTLVNEKYKNLLYGHEKGYIQDATLRARQQTPEQLREYLLLNEYYLENRIRPEENPYHLTGINFLCILLEGYAPFILLGLSVLFALDIFQAEFEEGSYKLSFTQPYKRKYLFCFRILSGQLILMGTFLTVILFFFILLGGINGFGDGATPRTIFSDNSLLPFINEIKTGNIRVASSARYILLGYLLLCAVIFMFSLLAVFITFILNSSSSALGLMTGIMVLSVMLGFYIDKNSIFHLINPMSYIDISSVLNNRIHSWYLFGLIINGGLGVLFFKGSAEKFCTMDMQGGNYS